MSPDPSEGTHAMGVATPDYYVSAYDFLLHCIYHSTRYLPEIQSCVSNNILSSLLN